jgi:hypothetical protein
LLVILKYAAMIFNNFEYRFTAVKTSDNFRVTGYNSPYPSMSNPPEEVKDIEEAHKLGLFNPEETSKEFKFMVKFIKDDNNNIVNKIYYGSPN